jgi:hypothetical protein
VEQGTHEQLIGEKGAYFRLYNSQFESSSDPDGELVELTEASTVASEPTLE